MTNFVIRLYKESDIPLIFNSFTLCMRASMGFKDCPDKILYKNLTKLLKLWLEGADILVAHPDGHPDVVAGWVAYSGKQIVFCYVKYSYRRKGLFTRLIESAGLNVAGVSYLFSTYAASQLGKKYGWAYNPFPLYGGIK